MCRECGNRVDTCSPYHAPDFFITTIRRWNAPPRKYETDRYIFIAYTAKVPPLEAPKHQNVIIQTNVSILILDSTRIFKLLLVRAECGIPWLSHIQYRIRLLNPLIAPDYVALFVCDAVNKRARILDSIPGDSAYLLLSARKKFKDQSINTKTSTPPKRTECSFEQVPPRPYLVLPLVSRDETPDPKVFRPWRPFADPTRLLLSHTPDWACHSPWNSPVLQKGGRVPGAPQRPGNHNKPQSEKKQVRNKDNLQRYDREYMDTSCWRIAGVSFCAVA